MAKPNNYNRSFRTMVTPAVATLRSIGFIIDDERMGSGTYCGIPIFIGYMPNVGTTVVYVQRESGPRLSYSRSIARIRKDGNIEFYTADLLRFIS